MHRKIIIYTILSIKCAMALRQRKKKGQALIKKYFITTSANYYLGSPPVIITDHRWP